MVRVEYQIGEHPKVGSDAFGAFDREPVEGWSDAHYVAWAAHMLANTHADLRGEPVTFMVMRDYAGSRDIGQIPREPGPHRPD